MSSVLRTILRLFEVVVVTGARLAWTRLAPRRDRSTTPRALRLEFERLGVAWVKLGQPLALRFDLLPADYCQELLTIRYDLQPLADRTVRKVLRQELGRYPEELFAGFDPNPIAVTTSGQIHKALSPEGEILAVKIQ